MFYISLVCLQLEDLFVSNREHVLYQFGVLRSCLFLIENMFYISLVCLQPEVLFVSNREHVLYKFGVLTAGGSVCF